MKVRTEGNSIRLRLTPDEVADLEQNGEVRKRIEFAPREGLTYRLRTSDAPCIGARFDGHTVTLDVPKEMVHGWASDDRIGFEEEQPTGTGTPLRVLIEKDLHCLHRDEPAGSRFPNPGSGSE